MRIQQIMSMPAITCSSRDSLSRAASLMWEYDIGIVLVVEEGSRLVGVITDRDICMAAYTKGKPLEAISVSTAMAHEVFSVHPGDSLETVERLMKAKQVRRVPVVNDEGQPIGLLSINDIVRRAAQPEKADGTQRELLHTLGAICEPRSRTVPVVTAAEAAPAATVSFEVRAAAQ